MPKLLLALLTLLPVAAFGQTYDNFTDLSHFTVTSGGFTVANHAVYQSGGGVDVAAYTSGSVLGDQYVCGKYTGTGTSNLAGPAGRLSSANGATSGFITFFGQNQIQIYSGNNHAGLTSGPQLGHEYCLLIAGTTASVTDNGSQIPGATLTDPAVAATGYVGISSYGGGDAADGFTGWRAGAGTNPGAPPQPSAVTLTTPTTVIETAGTLPVTCTPTFAVAYAGTCSGVLTPSNANISVSNLTVTGQIPGTASIVYSQGSLTSNTINLTVNQHARVTWYVRTGGGTLYTPNTRSGQCDGKSPASYPGTGVNQPCATNDYRWLYDQKVYGQKQWVIGGGDTIDIGPGQWRVGFDPGTPASQWCAGQSGATGCTNPTIPSGTPSQHTIIQGSNAGACSTGSVNGIGGVQDHSKMTQVFGGMGVYTPFNLGGAKYLDISCIEITRHSQCVTGGSPAYPSTCVAGVDDFDADGIEEDNQTSDVTLTDLWIHGHPGRGVKGPIGGPITSNRVVIGYNMGAGWDFDNGYNGASDVFGPRAAWNFNYSTIEWSGCAQEYPIVHNFPAISCYGQQTGGYGDGLGSAPGQGLDVSMDHSIFRYNTQDGNDFGHVDVGRHRFQVTNSLSYANGGQSFKWGWGFTDIYFANNVAINNCDRLAEAPGDAQYIVNGTALQPGDLCRAGDSLSFNLQDYTTAEFYNNTIVTTGPTGMDVKCVPISGQGEADCNHSVFRIANNIFRGYADLKYQDYHGNGAPGLWCFTSCNGTFNNIGTIYRSNNIFNNFHGCEANAPTFGSNSGYAKNESCLDPLFVNEPTTNGSTFFENQMDAFNVTLSAGSPARGAGIKIPGLANDYEGNPYAATPSIGALEGTSTFVPNAVAVTYTPTLKGFAINPRSISVPLDVNVSSQVHGYARYSDGETSDVSLAATWTSANPAIVSVAGGFLTGKSAGTTYVTALFGAYQDTVQVTVEAPSSITGGSPVTMTPGYRGGMGCTVHYPSGAGLTCPISASITSDNTNVVAVDQSNLTTGAYLNPVAAGTANIVSTYGGFTSSFPVTVIASSAPALSYIDMLPHNFNLAPGASQLMTCTAYYVGGTTGPCPYATLFSSDTYVATVNGMTVTALQASGVEGGASTISVALAYAENGHGYNFDNTNNASRVQVSGTATVTPQSIAFVPPTLNLPVNVTTSPACVVTFSDTSAEFCTDVLTSFSSDAATGTADPVRGSLSGVSAGTGHLVAALSPATSASNSFTVGGTAPPPVTLSGMTIAAAPSSGTVTFTSTFSSRCTYSDGSTGACPTVTYSSTSAGVTISGSVGTFAQAGTAVVTGHLAGVPDAATSVTVAAAPPPPPPAPMLTSVSAALSTYIVPVGGTSAITCTANYSDGSRPTFTGTANSQTPALATVSGFTARAVAAGSATLQCAQGSFTANATLTVTAAAPAPATTSPFSGNILISLGVIWLKVATGPASVKLPPGTVAKVCAGTVCTGQVAPASGIVSAVQGQDIQLAVMAMGAN